MSVLPSEGRHPPAKLMVVAVMAAVRAYLDDEARSQDLQASRPVRAWKLAAWKPVMDAQLRRDLSWRGRSWAAPRQNRG